MGYKWCGPEASERLMPFVAGYGRHNKSVENNDDYVRKHISPWYFDEFESDEPGMDGVWTETYKAKRHTVSRMNACGHAKLLT
jgi:hypothetical protein